MQFRNISIIIPVLPQETSLGSLIKDLKSVSQSFEVIVVGIKPIPENHPVYGWLKGFRKSRYVYTKKSRAKQLNCGAAKANGRFLWFLHADSRLSGNSIRSLKNRLHKAPKALHYFHLRFLEDGPPLMLINEIGCWVRSNLMGVPFGDQGFCVSKQNFLKMGGYLEGVKRGEDHLFVWQARQNNIPLQCTHEEIYTSARRYVKEGWIKLTLDYAYFWIRQAYPEWLKLVKSRLIS